MKAPIIPARYLNLMSDDERASYGAAGMTQTEIEKVNEIKCERELHFQIENYLRLRLVQWWCHARMDRRTTTALGTPDFLFSFRGIPVAFEVKTARGKLSAEQEETFARMKLDGWRCFVIRSIDDARAALNEGKLESMKTGT